MPAEYSFVSRWEVPVGADRAWDELTRMLTAPETDANTSWWPAVTRTRPARRLVAGEELGLLVRSPLGYRLRVRLVLGEVDPPRRLTVRSDGDLTGRGTLRIEPRGDAASTIVIGWHVVTRRAWMNRTAWLLRPVFRRAHAHVMRAGERGLRRRLDATAA
ncbi:hypothetical protein ASD56_10150 [Microbacterium sp. Root166]|uniref:hypothetical protein n=1 Tax=Microbacterium sp. Root166 TaxID=1736478 RepID=UPI0006FDF829|nr:hypothetical protein [Microbacterium sp. Root166]KQZ84333.1 hypothetical protein ASD56_10150 [Microbacterium sp. Root166]